ncbi:MAG: SpoIIE family protein phosphatase [Rhodospirillales bacterium]
MPSSEPARGSAAPPAFLTIRNPSGAQTQVRLEPLPFRIGRHGDNDLVLRDSRASRHHARISFDEGHYILEDLKSSHGVFVNGQRVERKKLRPSDRIEFGFPDSYQIIFALGEPPAPLRPSKLVPRELEGGTNLGKLRAMLEVARALQTSRSTDDVLAAVVEAALAVTGCERGFLLLRKGDDLDIRMARSRNAPLASSDLRVPTRLLMRALNQRKDFLSMNFDPAAATGGTIADLELRSVVCVPLVRVRAGSPDATAKFDPAGETVGLLYMDSRLRNADLSSGNRELLATLALEASTVLENARLLEEQWARQQLEEELQVARRIQESLTPRTLPETGWFRAAASSFPSAQVGGDYLDVRQLHENCWSTIIADVSGKGVGAALLAALLQGIFLAVPFTKLSIEEMMFRLNRFLNDRTGGEQYATLFYCSVDAGGSMCWVNAGHPPPLLVRANGDVEELSATGVPVGMLEEAEYPVKEHRLEAGDKLLVYSDGITEARNLAGEFFGLTRLKSIICSETGQSCGRVHAAICAAVEDFTRGAAQNDDMSLAVLEYHPDH